jgi:hypothetical protein
MEANFEYEFHISKQGKNVHNNMCPETFLFVSYSGKNICVTYLIGAG